MKKITSYILVTCLCFLNTANAFVLCCEKSTVEVEVVSIDTPPCHTEVADSLNTVTAKDIVSSGESCCDCIDCLQLTTLKDDELLITYDTKNIYHVSDVGIPVPCLKSLYHPPIKYS